MRDRGLRWGPGGDLPRLGAGEPPVDHAEREEPILEFAQASAERRLAFHDILEFAGSTRPGVLDCKAKGHFT